MQPVTPKSRAINLYGPEVKQGPFLWSETLRTGHSTIDRQHQELYESFQGVSQLLEMPEVNMNYWFSMVIRKTNDYVLTHFTDEENLMSSAGYPDYHKHKLLHLEIIETLKQHQGTIKQLKTDAEKIVEARNLLKFLNEWLNTHVMVDDKAVAEFISRMPGGQAIIS